MVWKAFDLRQLLEFLPIHAQIPANRRQKEEQRDSCELSVLLLLELPPIDVFLYVTYYL